MIILNIRDTDNIQEYLDIVEQNGGGILNLAVATYNLTDDITIPNLTTLNGNGATLDFGGTAHGVKIIGTSLDRLQNTSLKQLTITNSSDIGVEIAYTDNPVLNILDNVLVNDCSIGVSITNSTAPALIGTFSNNGVNCEMDTVSSFEFHFTSLQSATVGNGLTMTNCSNATIFDSSFSDNTKNGVALTDCNTITFVSTGISDNLENGIKLISGNSKIIVNGSDISSNGTYGIQIVDNTSEDTLIVSNTFSGNSSGEVSDSGTGTLIRSNIGVADN